jgi:hypothetical protein
MRIMKPVFGLITLFTFTVNAEVFKCKSSAGEIIYQPAPCSINETPVGKLKIKEMTPEEVEKAKALQKAEEQEEATYDAEKAKAEKQRQLELEQKEKLDLEQRRIKAQEADANRKRVWRPGMYYPPPMNQ